MTTSADLLSLQTTELRSERIRVRAIIAVLAAVLVLVVIRGAVSLSAGYRGEAWPFALLFLVMIALEFFWLRFIAGAIRTGRVISTQTWATNIVMESALPTVALFLQILTPSIGPERAATSPVTLAYLLFVILSTLHLNRSLCWLAGAVSGAGYAAAAAFAFSRMPDMSERALLVTLGSIVSCFALILISGFAAGVVARQIREHVMNALQEAASRAKVERDLAVARTIQQSLLPKTPPTVEGFDIAGWNQPADETGGDYYDWQQLADGRISVTVADATGHGIGPALIMSSCRAYARSAYSKALSLSGVLASLSGLLHKDLPVGKFVTLVTGIVDPSASTLELTSAGHGPLFFYSRAEDKFHLLDAHGPPLGLVPGMPYDEPYRMVFGPGDLLVLVTDGFLEWVNADDEEYGGDRLIEVVRKFPNAPAAELITSIYNDLRQFAGATPQADDLTALVVRRL